MEAHDALRGEILTRFSPRRAAHILGCADTAADLARQYGANVEDALLAGLLHDITREETVAEQLKLCEKYGILLEEAERGAPMLLHARTGAAVAAEKYGAGTAVCAAIRWHTTGRAGMTLLDKIIWLADYIEPGRDYPDTRRVRELARRDLDGALLAALDASIRHLVRNGSFLHPDTVYARNELLLRARRGALLEEIGDQ